MNQLKLIHQHPRETVIYTATIVMIFSNGEHFPALKSPNRRPNNRLYMYTTAVIARKCGNLQNDVNFSPRRHVACADQISCILVFDMFPSVCSFVDARTSFSALLNYWSWTLWPEDLNYVWFTPFWRFTLINKQNKTHLLVSFLLRNFQMWLFFFAK